MESISNVKGSSHPVASATADQVSNLVATVCVLLLENTLSRSSWPAALNAIGSDAIAMANRSEPLVYATVPCLSSCGGVHVAKDEDEVPDEQEDTGGNEGTDEQDGTEDNEGTSDNCSVPPPMPVIA